jgi:hypothetical protein
MKAMLAILLASTAVTAWGGPVVVVRVASPVPALDAAGLVLLAVLVGGVAGWAAKRRHRR